MSIPQDAIHYKNVPYLDRDVISVLEGVHSAEGWFFLPYYDFSQFYSSTSWGYEAEEKIILFEMQNRRWVRVKRFTQLPKANNSMVFKYFVHSSENSCSLEPTLVKEDFSELFRPIISVAPVKEEVYALSFIWATGEDISEEDIVEIYEILSGGPGSYRVEGHTSTKRIKKIVNKTGKPMDLHIRTSNHLQLICPEKNLPSPMAVIRNCKDGAHYKIKCLYPPITLNYRPKTFPTVTLFSLSDLNYFKRQGNNATLFIHGFNVPQGKEGQLATELKTRSDEITHKDFIAFNTVYYDNEMFEKIYPEAVGKDYKKPQRHINGADAYEWHRLVEMHLNKAAGFSDDFQSGDYTRVVQVTWPGDVQVMNYIEAEHNADLAGKGLAEALKQLCDEGITTNIIAHSLGNRVLLSALHSLIEKYGSFYQKRLLIYSYGKPLFQIQHFPMTQQMIPACFKTGSIPVLMKQWTISMFFIAGMTLCWVQFLRMLKLQNIFLKI